jgi:Fe2+ transport system protein FeoA
MIATAERLASVLDAQVTDEAGHRLSAQHIEGIAAQVADKEQRLLAMGITPGTPMAQRLFL